MNRDTNRPTTPAPMCTKTTDELEREALNLDAIRAEGRRLVAFGFEMVARGGFECAIGDYLDLEG